MPRRGTFTCRAITPSTAATSEVEMAVGQRLGVVCGRYECATITDFESLLRIPQHPIWTVVNLINNAALDPRRVFHPREIRKALLQRRMPLRMKWMIQEAFGVYCGFRHWAVPRQSQPTIASSHGDQVPRSLRRNLRQHGVRAVPGVERRSMNVRASHAL